MVQVLLSSAQQQQHAMQGACTHPELVMLNMAGGWGNWLGRGLEERSVVME